MNMTLLKQTQGFIFPIVYEYASFNSLSHGICKVIKVNDLALFESSYIFWHSHIQRTALRVLVVCFQWIELLLYLLNRTDSLVGS